MNQRLIAVIAATIGLGLYLTLVIVTQQADAEPVDTDSFLAHLPVIFSPQDICANAPTMLGPANGNHSNNIIPLFKWNNGNDPAATKSRLRLAKDPQFNDIVSSLWSSSTTGEKHFRFSRNLDPNTTYYWQTWLECDEIDSPFSEVWSITTGSGGTILPAPNLVAPKDGTELSILPTTFDWSGVDGAVEYIMHWREVGRGGYTYSWIDSSNKEIYWLEPAADYEWWVSARNNYAIGNDSQTWQFKSPAEGSSTQLLHHQVGDSITIEQYGEEFIYTYREEE